MTFEVTRVIGADHPSLPGHFPDVALVPGVVILDEVRAALGDWLKHWQLTGIPSVKFLVPLRPSQPFNIALSADENGAREVRFCCRVEQRIIVEGRLEVSRN